MSASDSESAKTTATLPEHFGDLPPAERARVLAAGYQMTQLVYRHAAAIVVGPPPSIGGRINNGSGFVVRLDGKSYLGTAWHVVKFWLDQAANGTRVLFQVRDALLLPAERIVWKDEPNDLVFLGLTDLEVEQIGISQCEPVAGWPPPHPREGSYVLISGFPAIIRKELSQTKVELNANSTLLQVTTVRDRYVVCQFHRENWISFDTHGVPPPGTDLGGMSGGPVLAVHDLAYPLVGLVSEFSKEFELLYIRTLSHLPGHF